jgi:hypothetical protein
MERHSRMPCFSSFRTRIEFIEALETIQSLPCRFAQIEVDESARIFSFLARIEVGDYFQAMPSSLYFYVKGHVHEDVCTCTKMLPIFKLKPSNMPFFGRGHCSAL